MAYRAYIDARMKIGGKVKWVRIDAMPLSGTYLTKIEADAQARDSLRYWKKHHKPGTPRGRIYGAFRSRVVKR